MAERVGREPRIQRCSDAAAGHAYWRFPASRVALALRIVNPNTSGSTATALLAKPRIYSNNSQGSPELSDFHNPRVRR